MLDTMNEITQFSPYAGTLFLETVPGDTSAKHEAENEAAAGAGKERTMYCYAPVSGCPDFKQTQVLVVLRDGNDEASAKEVLRRLALDQLAEEKHVLLLLPNPTNGGWNYAADPGKENDMDYLIRCFATLRGGRLGVNGFNGMTFYVADTPGASALLMTFAALKPLNAPAVMLGAFPTGYTIPAGALHIETAAFSSNPTATAYFAAANGADLAHGQTKDGVTTFLGKNSNVRLLTTQAEGPFDATALRIAWDRLFSETRRWQNDTYGTYQKRTNFTQRGFTAHVNDTCLGCNDGRPQTWYEYVPPQLRGTGEKVPLLFYFHGGSCVPLYGAEQSDWHNIADRENFIVVYPKASYNKMWNVWNDASNPSDEEFLLRLIAHMKTVHPIDEGRIYLSGFSMGAMMSNAMAAAHPELFAAAAPCNAYHEGYLNTYANMMRRWKSGAVMDMATRQFDEDEAPSPVKLEADAKKAAQDYRMPVLQTIGLLDGTWPITDPADKRLDTFDYWKAYNNIATSPFCSNNHYESGLVADENFYDGRDKRFLRHRWHSKDAGSPVLYELLFAKRMPHAVDLRTFEFAWAFLKKFSRSADGSLQIGG